MTERRWSEVFTRSSRHPRVFSIKNTRGRYADISVIRALEGALIERGVPHAIGSSRGAWDHWRNAGFAFLDGGYTSRTGGDGWIYGGGFIGGYRALRLACGELGLVPPRRLADESQAPTHQDLLNQLTAQLSDQEAVSTLERLAEEFAEFRSYHELPQLVRG